MATLHHIDLPDALLEAIKRRAQARGITLEQQLVQELSQAEQNPATDDPTLLAQIRTERDEMAGKGIDLTDELLTDAKNWGRE